VLWLENSGHNVLIDGERERVWEESIEWIGERVGRDAGGRRSEE